MPQPLFWRIGSPPAPIAAKPERAQSAMRLAAQYAAFAGLSEDLQALAQEACHVAAEGLGTRFAKLLVYDDADQRFLVVAGVGWQPGVIGHARLEADTGTAAGFAWHTGQSVVSNALGEDKRFRVPELLAKHGLKRSINVPVPSNGQVAFGVLEVESSEGGEFGADDAHFLRLLSHTFAAARDRVVRQSLHDAQSRRSADEHQMSLREMQHRVRNDLQGICSSIDRESRRVDDAEQRASFDRVSRRVLALAGLYDHLLAIQSSDTVEMGAHLSSLCLRIAAAADLSARGITLRAETQPIRMAIDRAGRLAVAVNELIANAAKHAFPNGQAGKIVVCLFARVASGDGFPIVTVSDNGCGFKGPRSGSAGLDFVDRLVREAGGVLTRSDKAGTEWKIALTP